MRMEWWSPEVKQLLKTVLSAVPAYFMLLNWPSHPYLDLSVGLCIGLLISNLIPPRATPRLLAILFICTASIGPLYKAVHELLIRP